MIYLVADDTNLAHFRQFGFCGTKGVFVLMVTHRGTTTETHGTSGEVLRNMTGGKEKKRPEWNSEMALWTWGRRQRQLLPNPEQIWAAFGIILQVLRCVTVSLDSVL